MGGGGDLRIVLLSFCESRFSGGDTTWCVCVWGGVLELYSVQKNLLEHFQLTGGGAGGTLGIRMQIIPSSLLSHPRHLVEFPLPNFSSIVVVFNPNSWTVF